MPLVAAYHRPTSIDEALALLAEPNRTPLAGGTTINADRAPSALEVVDLQALGLSEIDLAGGRISIGATATLHDLMVADATPPWLADVARAEQPSTLRTLATVGGVLASADPDSVLLAALLAAGGEVSLAGADDRPLDDLVTQGVPAGAIITAVSIESGDATVAATGRTPADVPIVAAVAHANGNLALTGVAGTPVVVDADDPASGLSPTGDFRGSSTYRLELARILGARAKAAQP